MTEAPADGASVPGPVPVTAAPSSTTVPGEVGEATVIVDATAMAAEYDEEMADAWHWALLGLAGFLPDELISQARLWLAAGRRLDIAQAVTFAVVAGQLGVGGGEIPLVREELAVARDDLDLVRVLEELPLGERYPDAWEFRSVAPEVSGPVVSLPIDLTDSEPDLDGVERAIVAAARAEPHVVAVWRAWRLPVVATPWPPPRRVFVVMTEPESDSLAALAARLQVSLSAAGEPGPLVEICPAGVDTPPYQVLARVSGALLWAREPAVEVSLARVFDEVDPVDGPRFSVDRPRIDDGRRRESLLTYLDGGAPIVGTSTLMTDILDPARGEVVPLTMRTDGRWVWTDTVSYYLEEHWIAPDPDLVRHVEQGARPEHLDEVTAHRVLAHLLQAQREDDPVWVVPQTGGSPDPAEA